MACFYANENFPRPSVEALEDLGHDMLTMHDAGQTGQGMSDKDVLEFARRSGRILLTLNRRHFIRLHGATPDHAGIVVCTYDPDFVALAHRIHEAVSALESLQGQLIRINRPHQ